jgi:hypothetical protein
MHEEYAVVAAAQYSCFTRFLIVASGKKAEAT